MVSQLCGLLEWKMILNSYDLNRKGLCVFVFFTFVFAALSAQTTEVGFLEKGNIELYPIGFYELPKDDVKLQEMADAGINIVHAHSREDLNRLEAAGILGIMPLPWHKGATEDLRAKVETVADHPALAVWEGPDEIIWNFTAASMLYRKAGVHKVPRAWWKQTPEAVAYAEEKAQTIIPNIHASIDMIRSIDKAKHPFWINEALHSDAYYVRQYLDVVDITGCDIYPVKKDSRHVERMGPATDRWNQVGKGKPVWMVLQAFAWSELGDYYGVKETAYPTFAESRFMAYDVIVHGAKGILYWGSHYLKSDEFRQSIYALTSELAELQPFLVQPDVKNIHVTVMESGDEEKLDSVRCIVRRSGRDWLVIVINENDQWHMDVEISGLKKLNGKCLELLYENEARTVSDGNFMTRLAPYQVKVYATSREFETNRREGRDFIQ